MENCKKQKDVEMSMAVVPWTFNNPRVDRRQQPTQQFSVHGETLEILQDTSADINVNQNTGLKLWDGAYLLSRYLENATEFPQGFWEGKRCVELGSGCGLVGMTAWLLGARVVLTDIDLMLSHTNQCLENNTQRLGGKYDASNIQTASYWWGSDCQHLKPPVDIILGSDVVYQKDFVKDLLKSLQDLSNENTVIYLAYKPRGLGEDLFFDQLSSYSFRCDTISRDKHPIEFQGTEYQLLKIVKDVI